MSDTLRTQLTQALREHFACCLEDPAGRDADTEAEDATDVLLPLVVAAQTEAWDKGRASRFQSNPAKQRNPFRTEEQPND